MIRVLVVDNHPAVRAGLVALLRAEPGLVPVASAADPEGAIAAARDTQPDVAVVDYHLKRGDGLLVCKELQALPEPPRTLIYSAFAGRDLGLPAAVAGAHAVIDKGILPDELFEPVRAVARGETVLAITPEAMPAGAARLDTEGLPILGLIVDGTSRSEIAEVLGLDERELGRRVEATLCHLKVPAGHDAQPL
jgi:DNA-binding NarL/FixJ family response regulator